MKTITLDDKIHMQFNVALAERGWTCATWNKKRNKPDLRHVGIIKRINGRTWYLEATYPLEFLSTLKPEFMELVFHQLGVVESRAAK